MTFHYVVIMFQRLLELGRDFITKMARDPENGLIREVNLMDWHSVFKTEIARHY